jgi:fused signal recognition particle receptor
MIGAELVILIVVLAAIGGFLFAVRRASERNQLGAGTAGRPRLAEPAPAEEEAAEETPAAPPEAAAEADEGAPAGEQQAALRAGLARTRGGFVSRIGRLMKGKQIDGSILTEVEEVLYTADIGPRAAEKLFGAVKGALSRNELADADAVWRELSRACQRILAVDAAPVDFAAHHPFVLLTIGVNGVGKTTTIGKIAAQLTGSGKRVLLAAGDTFRAAAAEQLEVWGQRAGAPVVRGKDGGDPSSVIFDAIKRGQAERFDVVIADTAGRLHTKVDLMEELKKVRRVVDKAMPGAPHETWLVLDATTGQNAIQQAQLFKEAMDITGIVLTKLDGTAKGGVILGICDELKVPVRYIGIGEQVADLRPFDPEAFVSALFEPEIKQDAA